MRPARKLHFFYVQKICNNFSTIKYIVIFIKHNFNFSAFSQVSNSSSVSSPLPQTPPAIPGIPYNSVAAGKLHTPDSIFTAKLHNKLPDPVETGRLHNLSDSVVAGKLQTTPDSTFSSKLHNNKSSDSVETVKSQNSPESVVSGNQHNPHESVMATTLHSPPDSVVTGKLTISPVAQTELLEEYDEEGSSDIDETVSDAAGGPPAESADALARETAGTDVDERGVSDMLFEGMPAWTEAPSSQVCEGWIRL